jgi:phosphoenolpyruvate carboxylase
MHQLDQKKLLIERILPYLTGAPADAAQRLQSVSDLEQILDDAITKRARAQATEQVNQHADEMRRESQLEGAFVHACRAPINNRYLCSTDSNRAMLENLLNPGEAASAKSTSRLRNNSQRSSRGKHHLRQSASKTNAQPSNSSVVKIA